MFLLKNKEPGQPIGVIPVDSIFTPVTKVNYNGKYRVGQVTDYDKLTWRYGRMAVSGRMSSFTRCNTKRAFESVYCLTDHVTDVEIMVEKEEDKKEKMLEMTIEELDLSVAPTIV